MEQSRFNYYESLLAVTTVVALADGDNKPSEVDVRVNMIFEENIGNDTLADFEQKFRKVNNLEKVYSSAIETLKKSDKDNQLKAVAWMWQVANVSTKDEDEMIDLGHLEMVENWNNRNQYVDLEELYWINRIKKDLKLSLKEMKEVWKGLPEAKRI